MCKKKVKAAIVGSRSFKDYDSLKKFIDLICEEDELKITEIISGGAIGADKAGEMYAYEKKIPTTIFKPDWEKYGKSAGFIRNKDIIKNCDVCFVFWDGESKGTKNDIELCEKFNKPIYLYEFKNEFTIKVYDGMGEWGERFYTVPVTTENIGEKLYDAIDRCVGEKIKLDLKQY